jgi:urea transport system permease protein
MRILAWVAVLVVACLLPLALGPYDLEILRDGLIYGIFGLSLAFLWGKTGLLPFGHAAFFGIGAFAAAVSAMHLHWLRPTELALIPAIVVPAAFALVLGYFLLYGGVRGAFFTILTLAVTLVLGQIAISWKGITGGTNGLFGIPPLGLGVPGTTGVSVIQDSGMYYVALGAAIVSYLVVRAVARSPFGRTLEAIRDNEQRAVFLGYPTSRYLLIALCVSAGVAGLAGGLYALMLSFIGPSVFALTISTSVIVWVAIGGRGFLLGGFVGALLVHYLEVQVSNRYQALWPLFLGLFFLIAVFVIPRGVLGYLDRVRMWARGRSRRLPAVEPVVDTRKEART